MFHVRVVGLSADISSNPARRRRVLRAAPRRDGFILHAGLSLWLASPAARDRAKREAYFAGLCRAAAWELQARRDAFDRM